MARSQPHSLSQHNTFVGCEKFVATADAPNNSTWSEWVVAEGKRNHIIFLLLLLAPAHTILDLNRNGAAWTLCIKSKYIRRIGCHLRHASVDARFLLCSNLYLCSAGIAELLKGQTVFRKLSSMAGTQKRSHRLLKENVLKVAVVAYTSCTLSYIVVRWNTKWI